MTSNSTMPPSQRADLEPMARQRQHDVARAALVLRRDRALADADDLAAELERYPTAAVRRRLGRAVALVNVLDEILCRTQKAKPPRRGSGTRAS